MDAFIGEFRGKGESSWHGESYTIASGRDIKKHNYNIRIIVIILKDILYKVAIEAVHGSTEGCR
jgi:hypothetical protein